MTNVKIKVSVKNGELPSSMKTDLRKGIKELCGVSRQLKEFQVIIDWDIDRTVSVGIQTQTGQGNNAHVFQATQVADNVVDALDTVVKKIKLQIFQYKRKHNANQAKPLRFRVDWIKYAAWPALAMTALVIVNLSLALGRQSGPGINPTAKVSGTVTLDGRPLSCGTVLFAPDASKGTRGPAGVGYVDADGKFEIATAGVRGALVGYHKICVHTGHEYEGAAYSISSWTIPQHYQNSETSELTAEVKANGANVISLELSSTP